MNFLVIVGFLAFIVFLILTIISLFKKNGKTKRNALLTVGAFVVWIACSANVDTEKTTVTAETEEMKDFDKKAKPKKEKEVIPTNAQVLGVVKKDMTFDDYNKAKKELKVQSEKNVSLGNGNLGSVIKTKEGYVVADTDGEKIFGVHQFKTEAEVDKYATDSIAKVEQAETAKAEAQKEKEKAEKEKEAKTRADSLQKNFDELIKSSNGVIVGIIENPYAPEGTNDQWNVILSDAWYNSQEHEKERFAETVGGTVESFVKGAGLVEMEDSVIVDFVDTYNKALAEERIIMGGYKIKR
ncbi:hypothetical protein [Bacillus sp. CECT 9360]|uniref:hypothetical protein n=1 Tax=Bacillus sp. CECT 9360 TaxID=2845821 RepID=UPI001E469537|nr:hypothetical protein [Bacillus sp. CECT 9360]CAH0347774.1 hypothetical protein BCI9360_04210 [Bacillus sp. CECT 9360]